jgi:hypothetical protein
VLKPTLRDLFAARCDHPPDLGDLVSAEAIVECQCQIVQPDLAF